MKSLFDVVTMNDKRRRVALLVDTSTDFGRRLIRGIASYSQQRGRWDLWIEPRGQQAPGRLPRGWSGDGVIARVASREIARHLPAKIVNISAARVPGTRFPTVKCDLQVAARLAAEHLLDRGFRNFGYVGAIRYAHVETHHEWFARVLAEVGCSCVLYRPRHHDRPHTSWHSRQQDLQQWLLELPKPAAVVTWTTDRGREVLNACLTAGLLVPEQVAVLSGDEDYLLCETCTPPLSGVALTSEQVGYEAASLLDRLLDGERPPKEPILIQPSRVIVRQSTNTLAIADSDLANAVAFIRAHADEPIQVGDVLRAVAVSRSWLERRFQETFRRSPAAEIRRVHLERAKQLLVDTDLPIPRVAVASGFRSREYLARAFKHATGLSPRQYRTEARGQ
jgi:LacI family transcriptional regulator